MTAAAAVRRRPRTAPIIEDIPNMPPEPCERMEAALVMAASNQAIADAILAHAGAVTDLRDTVKPIADGFLDLSGRFDKLCKWLRSWGVFLIIVAPWVLVAINAVTPEAAARLHAFAQLIGL